jgi:membrane protein
MRSPIDLIKNSIAAFIADDALSRGASIAFYSVTSMAPVLVIVVAVAGLVFGQDAAQGALAARLDDVIGADDARFVQDVVAHAATRGAGTLAGVMGTAALIISASGVFGEIQAALNFIWQAAPKHSTAWRMIRARLLSLALVVALGCLLLLSLGISAGLSFLGRTLGDAAWLAAGLHAATLLVSFLLLALVVAAIYTILPDTEISWRCAAMGGLVTAFLLEVGKFVIGLYLGQVAIVSAYGAAGSLLVVLLWTYYSAQIFLFGAEFTKVYARLPPARQAASSG